MIQQAEAAALALDDAQLVARAGLDGAHITGAGDNFEDALERLKPERIVGVGDLDSRDAAMKVGETQADYLLFGALDAEGNDAEATLDWACWCAEVFNVPALASPMRPNRWRRWRNPAPNPSASAQASSTRRKGSPPRRR